jgi:hypothetical protein
MCRFHRRSSKDGTFRIDWASADGALVLVPMLLLLLVVVVVDNVVLKRKGVLLLRMPCIHSSC